jgi:magnesium chelatase subunit I
MNFDGSERIPPFSFIVGHELLKKALIYCAIDPGIGGLLVRGEKGTGKTTAVRSFSHVLPFKEVVSGCRFFCVKGGDLCVECDARGESLSYEGRSVEVVELPLNASEDRVVGSIDIEGALREGVKRFEMGVLGEANGNILYIDEANLLEDHIVDLLLDVSVSGVNRVRREGVSFDHPCRFILVGTMNPEEGELRPQFMDRFGLSVEIEGFSSSRMRQEVVERVFSFEAGRDVGDWKEEDDGIRSRIETARENLSGVEIDGESVTRVCEVTSELGLYGMRGDIMLMRVARASSAYRGLNRLDSEGLKDGFALALPHRVKGDPLKGKFGVKGQVDKILEKLKI